MLSIETIHTFIYTNFATDARLNDSINFTHMTLMPLFHAYAYIFICVKSENIKNGLGARKYLLSHANRSGGTIFVLQLITELHAIYHF